MARFIPMVRLFTNRGLFSNDNFCLRVQQVRKISEKTTHLFFIFLIFYFLFFILYHVLHNVSCNRWFFAWVLQKTPSFLTTVSWTKDQKIINRIFRKISGLVFFSLNLVELSRSLSCSDIFCQQVLSRVQPFYYCVLSFQAKVSCCDRDLGPAVQSPIKRIVD